MGTVEMVAEPCWRRSQVCLIRDRFGLMNFFSILFYLFQLLPLAEEVDMAEMVETAEMVT